MQIRFADKKQSYFNSGCGNSYEADIFWSKDLQTLPLSILRRHQLPLKEKFKNNSNIQIVLGDFLNIRKLRFDY
jgi:hypothetical protein